VGNHWNDFGVLTSRLRVSQPGSEDTHGIARFPVHHTPWVDLPRLGLETRLKPSKWNRFIRHSLGSANKTRRTTGLGAAVVGLLPAYDPKDIGSFGVDNPTIIEPER